MQVPRDIPAVQLHRREFKGLRFRSPRQQARYVLLACRLGKERKGRTRRLELVSQRLAKRSRPGDDSILAVLVTLAVSDRVDSVEIFVSLRLLRQQILDWKNPCTTIGRFQMLWCWERKFPVIPTQLLRQGRKMK